MEASHLAGIFFVFSGTEIGSHFQWNLGDFFPNFEKKNHTLPQKKKQNIFFFDDLDFHSVTTHTILQFLMAKVCVIANSSFY